MRDAFIGLLIFLIIFTVVFAVIVNVANIVTEPEPSDAMKVCQLSHSFETCHDTLYN